MSESDIEGDGIYWDNVANTDAIFFPLCAAVIAASGMYGLQAAPVPHFCLALVLFTLVTSLLLFFFAGVHSRYVILWTYGTALFIWAEFDFRNDPLRATHFRYQTAAYVAGGLVAAFVVGAFVIAYLNRRSEPRFEGKIGAMHGAGTLAAAVLWFIGAHFVLKWF
ncbi:MAG TPA: hypothetical protein VH105_15370 [Burkholderiales bacterium]|jgi:hypothetical protein|nr:hypothetical protein [Burkholderiales bacterium]